MIYYKLDKQISIDMLARDIGKVLMTRTQQELQDSVLVVSIQKISDYAGDPLVLKIEYEGNAE